MCLGQINSSWQLTGQWQQDSYDFHVHYFLNLNTTTTDYCLAHSTHAHAPLRPFFSSKSSSLIFRLYGFADAANRPTNAASRCTYPPTVIIRPIVFIFSIYGDDRNTWHSTNARTVFCNRGDSSFSYLRQSSASSRSSADDCTCPGRRESAPMSH